MPGRLRRMAASGRAKKACSISVPSCWRRARTRSSWPASSPTRVAAVSAPGTAAAWARAASTRRSARASGRCARSAFSRAATRLAPARARAGPARILPQQGQDRPGVQPLAERPFEGRPVRAQQGAQPVRQPIGIGAEVGVVAAQQLQPRPGLVGRLQPDHAARMGPRHVGQDEGVLRVGLPLAGVEVARARHRRPVQVADRHAGLPAQPQQQRRRPAGLIDDERRLVLDRPRRPGRPSSASSFSTARRWTVCSVAIDAHGIVGRLADVHPEEDAWRHPSLPTPGSNRRCPPRIHVTRATTARPYPATVAHRACSGATPPGPSTAGGMGHAEHTGPVEPSVPARLTERKVTGARGGVPDHGCSLAGSPRA